MLIRTFSLCELKCSCYFQHLLIEVFLLYSASLHWIVLVVFSPLRAWRRAWHLSSTACVNCAAQIAVSESSVGTRCFPHCEMRLRDYPRRDTPSETSKRCSLLNPFRLWVQIQFGLGVLAPKQVDSGSSQCSFSVLIWLGSIQICSIQIYCVMNCCLWCLWNKNTLWYIWKEMWISFPFLT